MFLVSKSIGYIFAMHKPQEFVSSADSFKCLNLFSSSGPDAHNRGQSNRQQQGFFTNILLGELSCLCLSH